MKALPILVAILGVVVMAVLVGYFGAGAVMRSLVAVGGAGFVAICAIHLTLTAGMGLAWRALLPGAHSGTVIWARLVRDSGSEALPLSQVGGYVLGARALALTGVPGTLAAASTIVDVTLEFIAQLAYTALGLAWFVRLQPHSPVTLPVLLGLGFAALAATAFILVQRRGIGLF
ncbi:MAG: TIGR00374 family protein, partial [Stellaceae bacterium]